MRSPATTVFRQLWRPAVVRRLLVASGAALIVASLLAGRGGLTSMGWLQTLGCLAGGGLLGAGLLSSVARVGPVAIRWSVAGYVAASAFVIWLVDPLMSANWMLLGYAGAICLLLPLRFGAVTFAGILAIDLALDWISRIKVDLTGMPLTMLDIRIAAAHPAGLWSALGLPGWSRHAVVAALCLAVLLWISSGFLALRHRLRRGVPPVETWLRLPAIAAVGLVLWLSLRSLYPIMGTDDTTWHPDRVARLVDRTGILPFLAYSHHIESGAGRTIYATDPGSRPPGMEEVRNAVSRYISFPQGTATAAEPLPNVVMVLLESTFDPAYAFRLKGQWNAELFTENALTAAKGPLRVNTKGGGTWVAEFETITGLDSRLFGYSGAYTHASLAPFVERSLATWMRDRGYETWAFLANTGSFYNSRGAYESYGFERVLDSTDLGSETVWFETDVAVVQSVLSALGGEPAMPFFSYVMLIENHGPHECNPSGGSDFPARFIDTDDFAANCTLHEYLRRLDSTTTAVRLLLDYLQDLEARTDRPYVLLMFGDHQPSTFTAAGEFLFDFAPFRTPRDEYTTFFHVLSSAKRPIDCCSAALPIAALPTLVSGFVATRPEEVYVGENLWLYARCGSDAVRRDFADHLAGLRPRAEAESTKACEAAYKSALAAFRAADIVRLTTGTRPPGSR